MPGCFERGLRTTFDQLESTYGKDAAGFAKIEAKLAAAAGHPANGTVERDEIDQLVRMSKTTTADDGSLNNFYHQRVVDGVIEKIAGKGAKSITAQQWINRPR